MVGSHLHDEAMLDLGSCCFPMPQSMMIPVIAIGIPIKTLLHPSSCPGVKDNQQAEYIAAYSLAWSKQLPQRLQLPATPACRVKKVSTVNCC